MQVEFAFGKTGLKARLPEGPEWLELRVKWAESLADPVEAIEQAHVRLVTARGSRLLLVGTRLPPNYGPRYTTEFDAMYRTIAARARVPLVAFLLDGVALDRARMQADNLHPNASGQPALLDNVWPRLRPLLRAIAPPKKAG